MERRLVRPADDRLVGGVCAAVANGFGLDPFSVRLATVVGAFFSFGVAAAIYVVLWLALPGAPRVKAARRK
ncbi:PspC domain-containing protein [Microbacterium sp. NPDC089698]|uniref:PspC domain-containing protein n=1 Tax=Microbacterium sp. NPDC089698 TaxID=3364200 RepID=UPI00381696F5